MTTPNQQVTLDDFQRIMNEGKDLSKADSEQFKKLLLIDDPVSNLNGPPTDSEGFLLDVKSGQPAISPSANLSESTLPETESQRIISEARNNLTSQQKTLFGFMVTKPLQRDQTFQDLHELRDAFQGPVTDDALVKQLKKIRSKIGKLHFDFEISIARSEWKWLKKP